MTDACKVFFGFHIKTSQVYLFVRWRKGGGVSNKTNIVSGIVVMSDPFTGVNMQTPTKTPKFNIVKLEERIAPTILQVNGGGNIPNGNANGVPFSNPAGNQPPGWNK